MLHETSTGVVPVERYWLPAGSSYSLTPAGWLDDPAVGGLYSPNTETVTTGDLVGKQCVVLLGERGMGTTSAIQAHGALTPPDTTIETLHFDLGGFSSEDRLARCVFENGEVMAWMASSSTICLTLDSFDEAHNRIENLHQMLADYLENWDCGRLLLRIACRTADWPSSRVWAT